MAAGYNHFWSKGRIIHWFALVALLAAFWAGASHDSDDDHGDHHHENETQHCLICAVVVGDDPVVPVDPALKVPFPAAGELAAVFAAALPRNQHGNARQPRGPPLSS